ncbi:zinc ribbon domain-containing protein [Lachnospiraceae bacterium ASD3451]|uniref:zinc-ribbon domain-containing protein n=1 Tax=Diplocloster agilis TaxID=2850323 RepID=UPI001DF1B6FB|nr:zinc ribbon domain-containing protein [Diplocloster agilis]MBU9743493.1 zinc ribbon domain-containing protein [Diplocloster agilis]
MYCTKCGAEITEGSSVCQNCGADTSYSGAEAGQDVYRQDNPASEGLTGGYPAQEPAPSPNKKKLGLILGAAGAAVVILIIITVSLLSGGKKDGYYNGVKWGTSMDDVMDKIEGKYELGKDGNTVVEYFTGFESLKTMEGGAQYIFQEGRLVAVYVILNVGGSDMDYDEAMRTTRKDLEKLYGDAKTDDIYSGMNIDYYQWETKKSDIALTGMDDILAIMYKDIRVENVEI